MAMAVKRVNLSDIPGLNKKDGYIRVDKNASPAVDMMSDKYVFKAPIKFTTDEGYKIATGKKASSPVKCKICGKETDNAVICDECIDKYGDKIKESLKSAIDDGKGTLDFVL